MKEIHVTFFTHAYNGRGEGMEDWLSFIPSMEGVAQALMRRAASGRTAWVEDATRAIAWELERGGNIALAAAARAIGEVALKRCRVAAFEHVKDVLSKEWGAADGQRLIAANIPHIRDISGAWVRALCADPAFRWAYARFEARDGDSGRRTWKWACGCDGRMARIWGQMTWPRVEAALAAIRVLNLI